MEKYEKGEQVERKGRERDKKENKCYERRRDKKENK